MLKTHEIFQPAGYAGDVFRDVRAMTQEVFSDDYARGSLSAEEFRVLEHNWHVFENIRTGLGIENNQPFFINGSVSGKFIPNNYEDVSVTLLDASWNYILMAAPSGAGKSVLSRSHAQQANLFYGLPCVRSDRKPPHEDAVSRFANNDPVGLQRLRSWNLMPLGLGKRLVLLQAPGVGLRGVPDVKVNLSELWQAAEVEEEIEDSIRRMFEILFDVLPTQQKANFLLEDMMHAKPKSWENLYYYICARNDSLPGGMKDNYFVGRVKRARRYLVSRDELKEGRYIDLPYLLSRVWPCRFGGAKSLRPFLSLATDLFEGSSKHAFVEYYLHMVLFKMLKKGSLPGLWDCNDEVDFTQSSKLLRELSFWKARKLRACGYCSESATQDVSLFSKDMQGAAQSFIFSGSNNKEFARFFSESLGYEAIEVIEYLNEGEWCVLSKDFDRVEVFRAALPSFCAYPVKKKRLMVKQ